MFLFVLDMNIITPFSKSCVASANCDVPRNTFKTMANFVEVEFRLRDSSWQRAEVRVIGFFCRCMMCGLGEMSGDGEHALAIAQFSVLQLPEVSPKLVVKQFQKDITPSAPFVRQHRLSKRFSLPCWFTGKTHVAPPYAGLCT